MFLLVMLRCIHSLRDSWRQHLLRRSEPPYRNEVSLRADMQQMKENQSSLQKTLGNLVRHLNILQLLCVEERIRSDEHSEIKQVGGCHDHVQHTCVFAAIVYGHMG